MGLIESVSGIVDRAFLVSEIRREKSREDQWVQGTGDFRSAPLGSPMFVKEVGGDDERRQKAFFSQVLEPLRRTRKIQRDRIIRLGLVAVDIAAIGMAYIALGR